MLPNSVSVERSCGLHSRRHEEGWGSSLVDEHLPSMYEALGLFLNIGKKAKKKNQKLWR
jgi:hypothetical protein